MCGIVGIFARKGPAPHSERWEELVNHLQHRGPDEGAWWADGPFFFGHRRLSIIGLASGHQPMATADGRFVVTYNGEIYNYVELRRELERSGCVFQTDSDTEVLLHGYVKWGTDLPSHLVGMFAFGIADRDASELFLARDRFGEKPLFYTSHGDYVAFASELRPLAALPDLNRAIDIEALGGYLSLNYVPGTRTMMEGVHRIRPGHWKRVSPDAEQDGCYWSPPQVGDVRPVRAMDGVVEEWRELFDDSVRLCLRSDVPVGIFLSGGMDSSLVAESAMRQGNLSTAYFIDFEDESYREYDAASEVANRLGIPLERTVLTPAALGEFLSLVEHADDPLADSSSLPVWVLSRLAATGNKVVLGGDAGDELFAGYLTYRASQHHARLFAGLPYPLRRAISFIGSRLPTTEGKVTFSYKLRRFLRAAHLNGGLAHLSWNGTWLSAEAARLVIPGDARRTVSGALGRRCEALGTATRRCSLSELQRADVGEYLVNDILTKTDRMSMAHGLETRSPFLDYRLAEWALRLPEEQRIGAGGELKTVLRAAARKTFGPAIADRPKWGFSIPIHDWIRGEMGDTVRDLLSAESLGRTGILDPTGVGAIVDDHFSGRRSYGFEIWGLAVLVAWIRCRIDVPPGKPKPSPLIRRTFAN